MQTFKIFHGNINLYLLFFPLANMHICTQKKHVILFNHMSNIDSYFYSFGTQNNANKQTKQFTAGECITEKKRNFTPSRSEESLICANKNGAIKIGSHMET